MKGYSSYKLALDSYIKDWSDRRKKNDEQLKDYNLKIKQTTDQQKLDELEKEIDKLKKERESIAFPFGTASGPIPPTGSVYGINGYSGITGPARGSFGTTGGYGVKDTLYLNSIRCNNCNSDFVKPTTPDSVSLEGKSYVKCPFCGTENEYRD